MTMPDNLKIYRDLDELSVAAAALLFDLYKKNVVEKGSFTVALSGGSTPGRLYSVLAKDFKDRIDWTRAHVFWGDERCVPPESPESNYRLAYSSLLSKVDVPPGNVHRIRGELPPVDAARLYEDELRGFFRGSGVPSLDLVLLGLGEDGHTLSLFPGTDALNEKERLVAENFVERLNAWRVTMTLPLVNMAKNAVFLVSGRNKAKVLQEVIAGKGDYPASKVKPSNGKLSWMVDREASGQ